MQLLVGRGVHGLLLGNKQEGDRGGGHRGLPDGDGGKILKHRVACQFQLFLPGIVGLSLDVEPAAGLLAGHCGGHALHEGDISLVVVHLGRNVGLRSVALAK